MGKGFRSKDKSYSYGHAARRRRASRRKINMKRALVAGITTVVTFVCGYSVYSHLPVVKANKAIAAGNRYSENAEYDAAIDSYTEAIEIDAGSVKAYSNMATAYLSIDDSESAKKVLYDGWQNTESEALLTNYLTVIMNDAVNTMNKGEGSVETVLNVLEVLEQDNSNKDAIAILDAAYDRCFAKYSDNVNDLFRSSDSDCSYDTYKDILNRLLLVYSNAPGEELKKVILKYAEPAVDSVTLDYSDVKDYNALLDNIQVTVGTSAGIEGIRACLANSVDVLAVFEDIFEQLDVGNVDELREFVVSDKYLELRDIFLNDEETPQENTTYVPISREAIILNRHEDSWSYRFLDFQENPLSKGVITLWANYFEDDGVQRNSISYEPGAASGNVFPHTKYTVTYLRSYTSSGSDTKVIKMNYRLSTAITDAEGNTTETIISDWGGTDEYEMDIKTIESRIRA